MGKVITLAEYKRLGWMQRGILPVFCCMPSAEAQPVLLNQRLAKLLQDLPASKRRYNVKSCMENLLQELPEYSLLGRFAVFFPRYYI